MLIRKNTFASLVFKDIKGFLRLNYDGKHFCLPNGIQFPVGTRTKLILISKDDDVYYYADQHLDISAYTNKSISLKPTDEKGFKTQLKEALTEFI